MGFFIENGQLCLNDNHNIIRGFSANLEVINQHGSHIAIFADPWSVVGETATAPLGRESTLSLTVKRSPFGILLSSKLQIGPSECFENVFDWHIRCFLPHRPKTAIYNDGTYDPGKRILDMTARAVTTALVTDQEVSGADYIAYRTGNGIFGVIGAVTFDRYFTSVSLSENGMTQISIAINEALRETITLKNGCEYETDAILICMQSQDALPVYGKAIAEYCGVKKKFSTPMGWCSWYYYLDGVSEKAVLENASVARQKNLPFQYIQIDDGWENNKGDWLPNEKFPSGMKALADTIKEKGFLPGIWVAPFLFDTTSQVYQNNPHWFIHNNVLNYDGYAFIDYSIPQAQDYLRQLFHRLSVEWGYRYIKVDLVSWILALKGYQNNFNALKNYRTAMQIIRQMVTDDTMILSCTAPLSASAPYADAARISMDIFDKWDSLKAVAQQTLKRLFINEYLLIDPDCIMLRNSEKEDGECRRFCLRDDRELETFLTFMSVSGGAVMNSDKLSLLNEKDLTRIRSLFPINTHPATALDLYERMIPSVFSYGRRGKFDMYAFINWTDQEQSFYLDLGAPFFQKGYFGNIPYEKSDKICLSLPPHASQIVYCSCQKEDFDDLPMGILPQLEI